MICHSFTSYTVKIRKLAGDSCKQHTWGPTSTFYRPYGEFVNCHNTSVGGWAGQKVTKWYQTQGYLVSTYTCAFIDVHGLLILLICYYRLDVSDVFVGCASSTLCLSLDVCCQMTCLILDWYYIPILAEVWQIWINVNGAKPASVLTWWDVQRDGTTCRYIVKPASLTPQAIFDGYNCCKNAVFCGKMQFCMSVIEMTILSLGYHTSPTKWFRLYLKDEVCPLTVYPWYLLCSLGLDSWWF